VGTGKPIYALAAGRVTEEGAYGVDTVAFSPDGKKIVIATYGEMTLWDTKTRKLLYTYAFHEYSDELSASAVAFSPNGKLIATASHNPSVDLWLVPPVFK
jgi:WD40 repeat protein